MIRSEFCDFLSTLLTFRLIKAFDRANLLEDHTDKMVISVLRRAKKARTDGGDRQLIRINPSHSEILQELELIPKSEELPKRKPGRLKGSKNKATTVEQASLPEQDNRKHGRPKGSRNKSKQQGTDPTGNS